MRLLPFFYNLRITRPHSRPTKNIKKISKFILIQNLIRIKTNLKKIDLQCIFYLIRRKNPQAINPPTNVITQQRVYEIIIITVYQKQQSLLSHLSTAFRIGQFMTSCNQIISTLYQQTILSVSVPLHCCRRASDDESCWNSFQA